MAERPAPVDAGFILLDAVLAAGLLALAGTVIVMIANTMLTQQQRELDRSVALVASQSLIKQYLLLGAAFETSLEHEDELFRYSFEPGANPVAGTSTLVEVAVWARPKSGRAMDAVRLDFLAPAATR
jgi:type II secretory pathway pseudopilin PulG